MAATLLPIKLLLLLLLFLHVLQARVPRITRAQGTHALILVPTRELAVQVMSCAGPGRTGSFWFCQAASGQHCHGWNLMMIFYLMMHCSVCSERQLTDLLVMETMPIPGS
jgi:hypothetical protein